MEEKVPKKKINFKAIHETYSTYEILSYRFANMVNIRGVTTLTNAVSGQSQKLLRESGDFYGNRDIWKFFRETRDNSGTLQKKILEFMSGIQKISGKVTEKFGRMIQISGTTYVKTQ